jgi:hypothetical protein
MDATAQERHMTLTKRDWMLVGAAIITIGLGLAWQPEVEHTSAQEHEKARPLLAAGLKENINKVTTIGISQGKQRTTLHQDTEGTWRVKELYDYPAALPDIRKTLLYLSQSELRDPKTDEAEKLERLGLDPEQRTTVTLQHADTALFHIILGRVSDDGGGTYVLVTEGTQSYLTSGQLAVKASPQEWLSYELFSVERSRVKRIRYQFSGKKNYAFVRETSDQNMRLDPMPKNGQMKERPTPLNPSYYFERLAFTDVLPDSKLATSTPDMTVMETFDGLVVTVRFAEVEQREWAQFAADVDPALRDPKHTSLLPLEKVQEEAKAINARTAGWLYELGQFNSTQLRSSYYDVVR